MRLEHPRLRRGCRVFEDEAGLVIRSSDAAYRVAPRHCESMRRIVRRLDGSHDYEALLRGERRRDAFYAIGMLSALAHGGLLDEGPADIADLPAKGLLETRQLEGVTLTFPVDGLVSAALGKLLQECGARLLHRDTAMPGAILVVSPDGPDLALLEETNRSAQRSGMAWLPVFPFGDAIVAGPLIRPGESPCFRCFELRWLGISPSIAAERSYFEQLRRGMWRDEALQSREDAERFAAVVSPEIAGLVCGADARVALIRPEFHSFSDTRLDTHDGCEVCADYREKARITEPPLTHADWFEPPVSLAVLRGRVKQAESFCGLASIIPAPEKSSEPQDSHLPRVAVARFALPEPEQVTGEQSNWSHGSAASAEDAETLAIIEAMERFTGLSAPSSVLTASYKAVEDEAILPAELPLFSPAQYRQPEFPFSPFDPHRPARWTRGFNITAGRAVLVPASAAWYGHDDELLGETSSGVAAHSSRGLALLSGALETVERDAFMIHWLHQLSPPLVDMDQFAGAASFSLIRFVEQTGYTVRVADMTTDLEIPAFLAIGFRTDCAKPALIIGAGASLDPAVAASRALDELCCAAMHDSSVWTLKPPMKPQAVLQLEDHCRAYQHPEWLRHASFLWSSERTVPLRSGEPPADPAMQLTKLIGVLRSHGHDLIGVDITGPEVARHGIRVVRAIVPGLQPLGFGRRIRLGGNRLYEAPRRMGYPDAAVCEEDLYNIPHCFP